MSFITKDKILAFAETSLSSRSETTNKALEKFAASYKSENRYDIFLSHKFSDAKLIIGLTELLKSFNYSVFVDWMVQPSDRSQVSKNTANWLRKTMKQCKCLLYAHSENSSESRWMPWELGYSDAIHGRVAVIPIQENNQQVFSGQEYLGLYPYIKLEQIRGLNNNALWVHETVTRYIIFDSWLDGIDPFERINT